MKKIFLYLIVSAAFMACKEENNSQITSDLVNNPMTMNNPDELADAKLPEIEFDKTFHEFGKVTDGEKVSYAFKFKNTGEASLIITNAYGSCGCTVPEYEKKPVPVGETGYIKAVFDSKGRVGDNRKTITVITNGIPNSSKLEIHATVVPGQKENPF